MLFTATVDGDLRETLEGKNSFDIEGIDHSDYPDYVDAFLSYGQYTDGTEMTDEELQAWQDDNPSLFYDILQDFIH